MMLGADVCNRIMVETKLGKPPDEPDTPEMAQYRQQVAQEIAAAEAQGLTLQIPND